MSKVEKGTEGNVEEVANAGTQVAAPVNPNAINFGEVRVENTLKFKPRPELNNLCTGKLIKVEIVEHLIPAFSEEGIENTWEYAGHTVPALELMFKQTATKSDPKERIYKHEYKVITSVDKQGIEVDPKVVVKLYTDMFAHLKHICNAFKGTSNYSEAVADINKIVIDPTVSVAERIVNFKAFLGYFAALLGGKDGKGVYQTIELWLKLVADYRTAKFLGFPTYVGEGFVERIIPQQNPSIEIKPNESIELVAAKPKSKGAKGAAAAGAAPESDNDVDDLVAKYNK